MMFVWLSHLLVACPREVGGLHTTFMLLFAFWIKQADLQHNTMVHNDYRRSISQLWFCSTSAEARLIRQSPWFFFTISSPIKSSDKSPGSCSFKSRDLSQGAHWEPGNDDCLEFRLSIERLHWKGIIPALNCPHSIYSRMTICIP